MVVIPYGKKFTEPDGLCTAFIDLEDNEDDTHSWTNL